MITIFTNISIDVSVVPALNVLTEIVIKREIIEQSAAGEADLTAVFSLGAVKIN